jgi:hypothetical protein
MIRHDPLLDIDVTVSIPDTLESVASNNRVTDLSTSSGPAPEYEVYIASIGRFISGYRSMGRFASANKPSPISSAKIMNIVTGRETTVFTMLIVFLRFD